MNFGALILAAGRSTRMGHDKALISVAGRTFLDWIVCGLQSSPDVDRIILVLGSNKTEVEKQPFLSGISIVQNIEGPDQLSSLQKGLHFLKKQKILPEALLLCPVDQPIITPELINALIDVYRRYNPTALIPTHLNRGGHPVVISEKCAEKIMLWQGSGGLRAFWRTESDVLRYALPYPEILTNVNTADDLEKVAAIIEKK